MQRATQHLGAALRGAELTADVERLALGIAPIVAAQHWATGSGQAALSLEAVASRLETLAEPSKPVEQRFAAVAFADEVVAHPGLLSE